MALPALTPRQSAQAVSATKNRGNDGCSDTHKAPNHAFRHWFKTACMKEGIQDSLADAIQGHRTTRVKHAATGTPMPEPWPEGAIIIPSGWREGRPDLPHVVLVKTLLKTGD
jgi:hypothetical protein